MNPGAKDDLKFNKIVENDEMSLQKEEKKSTPLILQKYESKKTMRYYPVLKMMTFL